MLQKRRPAGSPDILQQLAPLADGTFLQFLRFGCMGAVLLVEDHDEVHRVLCDLIKHAGHKTDCVKTIGEALALLAPGSHQLVIADVLLPDGRGYAVAERASALGIKTILMSGAGIPTKLKL